MAIRFVDSASGVTEFAKNTVYSSGDRVVPAKADTGTNHAVAKRYVWECTTGGTTHASDYPSWDASYTPDTSTEVSGTATFTCRNPGYSSGTTINWTFATPFFEYGIYAATTAGDIIYLDDGHSESLTADTTYTFNADTRVLCVDKNSSQALSTGAVIGGQSTNYTIALQNYSVYFYGITFQTGTATTTSKSVNVANSDNSHHQFENCTFIHKQTGSAVCYVNVGTLVGTAPSIFGRFVGCTFRFDGINHKLQAWGRVEFIDCSLDPAGATSLYLFSSNNTASSAPYVYCEGCDWTEASALVPDYASIMAARYVFVNCKFALNVTMMAAPTTVLNEAGTAVWAFNCSLDNDDASNDEHFHLYHGNALGETYVTEDVYLSDGAAYDGTNKVGWQIVTRASNCSFFLPYISPWVDVYHSGTSQIAPYFEALRSGSTTKYTNSEVWAEFSFQGTSGSTKASFVDDRCDPAADPTAADTDQTASSLGAGDWTGEHASDNAYMKLGEQNMTPAEIGHIRGRVCVGLAGATVYIDPKIRGLS